MSNPLYKQMQGQQMNPMQGFMQRFQQFRKAVNGNPQEQIQQLMNAGKVNQEQYNSAYQTAQQIMRMFGGK